MRRARFGTWGLLLASCMFAVPEISHADLGVEDAERIARATWYEGIPASAVSQLDPPAVVHLTAMLGDAAERKHHATILELLGRAGGPGAFEAIAAFTASTPVGEVDTATYRARLTAPMALGLLAREDDRAWAELARAAGRRTPRDWHYRHIGGERLGRILERRVVAAVALSARPEARALLGRLAREGGDAELRAHASDLEAWMASDGAAGAQGR